ncbi:hypothetical protein BDV93DRAFT_558316 [Ceratobasidium sp. AG-I]|nr:hypothetical protein BDV93DRAFT_558316 [Ceratobasidium sp. AG-I]
MQDLTTTNGILAYLSNTRFAATNVQLLSGGHSAFTYRAVLKTPLPTGETSVVLKHSEGCAALFTELKVEAARSGFEYEALVALAKSGLFNANSTVQIPTPLHYDPDTHTIFMTDLGDVVTLSNFLSSALDDARASPSSELRLKEAFALASEVGSALGDFMGRFHYWSALPEQTEVRERFSKNVAGVDQCMSLHLAIMAQSMEKLGLKESWVDDVVRKEQEGALSGGRVLAMGDFWIGNVLVSRDHQYGKLRLYIVDWEMVRPIDPEYDIGEITAAGMSFAHRYGVQDTYPLLPALHHAYRSHLTLDPSRVALVTGIDVIGACAMMPWARDQSEDFLKCMTTEGCKLLKLSLEGAEESIRTLKVMKELFGRESQQLI